MKETSRVVQILKRGSGKVASCVSAQVQPFCSFVVFITLFAFISIMLAMDYGSLESITPWEDATFDWKYEPTLPPVDPEYANCTVFLDGHAHSTESDGNLSPEQNIQWHIANGFNAMIVSGHDELRDARETQRIAREKYFDTFKVIVAMELTTCKIHMNLVGVTKNAPWYWEPDNDEIAAVVNATHLQGGIAVVNHIPWTIGNTINHPHPTIEQLYNLGVDYVEIVDEFGVFDFPSYLFAKKHGMGVITGCDMHSPSRGGVYGWTVVCPSEFTEESIMRELRARRTSFIYNPIPAPKNLTVVPDKFILFPFYLIHLFDIFFFTARSTPCATSRQLHLDIPVIASAIFWLFLFYLSFLVIYYTLGFLNVQAVKLASKWWVCIKERRNDRKQETEMLLVSKAEIEVM